MSGASAAPTPTVTQPDPTWPAVLTSLLAGEDLRSDSAAWAMDQVMSGSATPAQLAAFLIALRAKGETVEELGGLVRSMLEHAVRIEVPGPSVDIVGTGGDRHHTVNISTMASIVVAGTGRRVVKHGNRAASSSTGTADVLERLGVRLDHTPQRVAELATEVGITFCFAQAFHPAMRHAGPTRGDLGVPTVFNFLGPLANPAQPAATALGVADARMAGLMAGVLADRGASALVFRGEDGLDELAATVPSRIWMVNGGDVREEMLDATDLGLSRIQLGDLRGGDATANAATVRSVLAGTPGPVRETVLLNAAAGIAAFDAVGEPVRAQRPLLDRLHDGMAEAAAAVDDGRAAGALNRWIAASAS